MLRLRVRAPSGKSDTVGIAQQATLAELKAAVERLTGVPSAAQRLLVGFPPHSLPRDCDERPLSACGLRTGDTLTVASGGSGSPAPTALRVSVQPDDHSCLFHSIGRCVSGQSADGGWRGARAEAAELRWLVAASILSLASGSSSSSESAVSAYLSSLPSVESYAAAMAGSTVWGGALECAVLSESLVCRIRCVDVESGALYSFGSTGAYCCYLLFSGVHYDSLYSRTADSVTMFGSEDEAARQAALAAGEAARSSGKYTSLSACTLRCLQCGVTVRGQQEAVQHGSDSNHTQFEEYKHL